MTLPARTAVLNYLYDVESADVDEVMAALKDIYGTEKQFTKDLFLDHLMALEANGLVELASYELLPSGELSMRYKITQDGRSTVDKYVSKVYR